MNELHLPVIDRTIHKTRAWLDDVMTVMETTDRVKAFRALRSVLHAVRDVLTVDETAQFAAQMPLLLRGLFYEGWRPRMHGRPEIGVDEFVAQVAVTFGDYPTLELEHLCRSVFRVICVHLSGRESVFVTEHLPSQLRAFLLAEVYRAPCEPLVARLH